MSAFRVSIFALVVLVLLPIATTAVAQDFSFRPWSDVTNVCPSCEQPPGDVITLRNGNTVQGTIRAINPVFYTVERFGEIRTVPTGDVRDVEWKRGSQPSGLDDLDQIVLLNGHVLTGRIIVDNDRPPYFKIESSYLDYTYTVFKSQAQMVFRDGREYDFRAAMNEVEDVRESDD
jgi:hypothetical protein